MHDKHKKAVEMIRPEVDIKDQNNIKYDRNAGKSKYYRQKREKEVENDNNILLQKIFGIISSNSVYKKQPGPKSLNLVNRIKESKRINESNKKMVGHLMNIEPTYKFNEFKKHKMDFKKKSDLVSKFKRKKKTTKFIENYANSNYKINSNSNLNPNTNKI